jgi:hypothetical protein
MAQSDNIAWRIRFHYELYALYEDKDIIIIIIIIIIFTEVDRLKWAAHVVQMDWQLPEKRILNAKPEGRRKRGRPKLRWDDGMDKDVKALGKRNWKNIARSRQIWQNLLTKSMAQKRLSCQ